MAVDDPRQQRVRTFVTRDLEPGEQIEAIVPVVYDGPMWAMYAFGYLSSPLVKIFAFVLTDRRLLVVRCSPVQSIPVRLRVTVPREQVSLVAFAPRRRSHVLALDAGGHRYSVTVGPLYAPAAEHFAAQLGGA